MSSKDSKKSDFKPDIKPNIVTGTVELIVTPELREKIERKRFEAPEDSLAWRRPIYCGTCGS